MKKTLIGAAAVALGLAGALTFVTAAQAAEDCETVTVTGREGADSGENGNDWATTTLTRTTKVCATTTSDTYVATVTDSGEFVTRPGESPGLALATLKGDVRGTVNGGFTATFTAPAWDGTLATPPKDTSTSEWVAAAFPGVELFNAAGPVAEWRWVYNLCGEKGEWWVNAEAGNSGDITEKACPTPSPSPSTSSPTPTPSQSSETPGNPTPSQSTVAPTPSQSTSAAAPGATPSETESIPVGAQLPVTGGGSGVNVPAVFGVAGIALIAAGAGLLLVLRRRRDNKVEFSA